MNGVAAIDDDRTRGNKQVVARLVGLNRSALVAKLRRRDETGGMALAWA